MISKFKFSKAVKKSRDILSLINNFNTSGQLFGNGQRNVIKIFDVEGVAINIKSFKIPNSINKVAYRYFRKSKARRSFEYAAILLEKGIGTPQPLAFLENFSVFGLRDSYYVSEHLNADLTYRELVEIPDYPDHENILRQFTRFSFNLHEKGIEFIDHSPGNTLIKKNKEGYNELLLSALFYERFLDSEYILIYQLDAFVFKDELTEWCKKGYDYIGAPWIASEKKTIWSRSFHSIARKFRSKKKNDREQIFYKAGNGGFSLRKTASHYSIAKRNETFILDFLKAEEKEIYAIEDVFWSLKAPELSIDFKIPGYKQALSFAIDRKPKIAFKLNNNQLPFGCHGINKPKVIGFWKPILDKY